MKVIDLKYVIALLFVIGIMTSQVMPAHAVEETDVEDPILVDTQSNLDVYDPLEPFNRVMFTINTKLDKFLVRPIARGYQEVVPQRARKAVHSSIKNLQEPITFLNSVLQGNIEQSVQSLGRFMINSTIGLGGLFEIADRRTGTEEDFGQTLGHYNLPAGPYLVLPLLGPSNVRDGVGRAVDVFSDPFYYALDDTENMIRTGITGVDLRSTLMPITDDIEETSFDPYATYRSMYQQHRENLLSNGKSD